MLLDFAGCWQEPLLRLPRIPCGSATSGEHPGENPMTSNERKQHCEIWAAESAVTVLCGPCAALSCWREPCWREDLGRISRNAPDIAEQMPEHEGDTREIAANRRFPRLRPVIVRRTCSLRQLSREAPECQRINESIRVLCFQDFPACVEHGASTSIGRSAMGMPGSGHMPRARREG